MSIFRYLRKNTCLSERDIAKRADISRATLRTSEEAPEQVKVGILQKLAAIFHYKVVVCVVPFTEVASNYSTVAVSLLVQKDGFESWKIHFFNLVDEFRGQPDIRLIMLPPVASLDERLQAMLASIVQALCLEVGYSIPDWAKREHYLSKPWFVSEMESLKASAIVESPMVFRRNNIFVQQNILSRA